MFMQLGDPPGDRAGRDGRVVAGRDGRVVAGRDGRVVAARAGLPTTAETDRLAEWFRVLGDPTRARLLYVLVEAGELCVRDLAEIIDTAESTVSHALRWLRALDIVRARRDGRMVHYRLADDHVRRLLQLGREHLQHRERDDR